MNPQEPEDRPPLSDVLVGSVVTLIALLAFAAGVAVGLFIGVKIG